MSFLMPKVELPNSLADNTPGRSARQSPTQVVPLVLGRARVVVQWVTPVLHWTFRTTSRSQYAFFSCYGWICLGPVDEIVQLVVNGNPYNGIFKFREDYPGSAYVDHVISKETPERFRLWWGLEDHANYGAYIQGLVKDLAHPMAGKTHPAYRGICAIAVQDMEAGASLGGETPPLPKIEVELYRRSPTAYSFGYAAHGTHPIGIVQDLLTLKRGGLKLPASYFDDAHWTEQKQKIMDVGVAGAKGTELFTSFVFAEPKQVDEQISDVLSYIDGFLLERNGKLRIGYCPNDGSTVNPAGLREINQHHLAGDIEDEPGDTDNMASSVIVTGLDWTANPPLSEASETAPVPFAQRFLGEQRPPRSYNRPGFCERSQLKSAATLMAAILANPDWKATVPVLRPYDTAPDGVTPLRPGDLFVLNTDQVGGANFICRVLARESDTPVSVVFKVQRERGTFPKPYSPALDPRADTTQPTPPDLVRYAVKSIPPAMAIVPAVTTLVERPSTSVNRYELHYSPTNAWPGQVIATLKSWAVGAVNRTALAETGADVTITVDTVGTDWGYILSQSALEQNDDTLVAVHGREWFSVGAITPLGGGSYTVALKRARLDSTAEVHANGDLFFFCYRELLDEARHETFSDIYVGGVYDAAQATKWFKLRPLSNGGEGNLTAAFSLQLLEPDVVLDDPNQFADFIFFLGDADSPPATPVGDPPPAGWDDAPHPNVDPTKAEYMSKGIRRLDTGALIITWSAPVRVTGPRGTPAITLILDNDNHSVPSAADGSAPVLGGAYARAYVFLGTVDDSANWTFAAAPSAGVTGAFGVGADANKYTVTGLTADAGYVDISATRVGYTSPAPARFSLSKAKQGTAGNNGADSTGYWLVLDAAAVKRAPSGAYTPASINVAAKKQTGTGAVEAYACRFIIADTADGVNWTDRYTSAADESAKNYVPSAGIKALRVRMYLAGGTATLLDEEVTPIVDDGASPVSMFLDNDNHSVPSAADGSAPVLGGAVSRAFVFIGANEDTANWTFAAAPSAGVTGAFGVGADANKYTVTGLTADAGYVDISATRVGYTSPAPVRFSLSKAKQGTAGNNGADSTAYWLVLDAAAVKRAPSGAYTPASLNIAAKKQTGAGAVEAYACRFIIADTVDGVNWTDRYTSAVDESAKNYVPNAGIKALRVRMYLAGGTATLLDEEVTPIVDDGSAGADGADGDSVQIEWSVDGTGSWHYPYVAGDYYYRQKVGSGAWSAAIKGVGEDGAPGGANKVATPVISFNPESYTDPSDTSTCTITCATSGATIWQSYNGVTKPYTVPFLVTKLIGVVAWAEKADMAQSDSAYDIYEDNT